MRSPCLAFLSLMTTRCWPTRAGLGKLFRLEQTRPLTYFTFWLNQSFGGWHVCNLGGHLLAVFLIDRIARRLLPLELAPTAALLFAVHPLLSEPVQDVFARSSLLATSSAWRRSTPGRASGTGAP
jgi:hypothetical protein